MRIKWLDLAVLYLHHIYEYIFYDNLRAAGNLASLICDCVDRLVDTPHLGGPGRVLNTRELVLSGTPYIIVYRVKDNSLEILRVLHSSLQSSLQWPNSFL